MDEFFKLAFWTTFCSQIDFVHSDQEICQSWRDACVTWQPFLLVLKLEKKMFELQTPIFYQKWPNKKHVFFYKKDHQNLTHLENVGACWYPFFGLGMVPFALHHQVAVPQQQRPRAVGAQFGHFEASQEWGLSGGACCGLLLCCCRYCKYERPWKTSNQSHLMNKIWMTITVGPKPMWSYLPLYLPLFTIFFTSFDLQLVGGAWNFGAAVSHPSGGSCHHFGAATNPFKI